MYTLGPNVGIIYIYIYVYIYLEPQGTIIPRDWVYKLMEDLYHHPVVPLGGS